MSTERRIWKVRRDGVRQRYRVAEPAYDSSTYKTLARAYADAYSQGKVERYKSMSQIPRAEQMFPELARIKSYDAILTLIEHLGAQGARAVPALRWIYEQSAEHIADDNWNREMIKSSAREAIAGIGGADADQFHADILYGRFPDDWYMNNKEKKGACVYFGKHYSDVGVEALSHILHHADFHISKVALEAITKHDDPRLTAAIAAAIDKPPSEHLFREIIKQLPRLNMRDLAPHVLDAVKDVESDVRSEIVSHIRGMRDHETIAAFIQHGALKHPNFTVREAMCDAIGASGYEEASMNMAWMAQNDGSKRVRDAARRAWKRLGGV